MNNIIRIKVKKKDFNNFSNLKKIISNKLKKKPVLIVQLGSKLHNKKIISFIKSLSVTLGDLVPQNNLGKKYIYVFDRKKNTNKFSKQRYHQTRDGGYIHTDNVNIKERWDFMVLGCVSKGMAGGETILIFANELYKELKKFPNVVRELKKNFFWYKKGFSNEIFKRPILTLEKDKVEFRYLRSYLEEAYDLKKIRMSSKQIQSLNLLDSLLGLSKLQKRVTLEKGDILIGKDSEFLHGRTEFVDSDNAISIFSKNKKLKIPYRRTLVRAWIRKN